MVAELLARVGFDWLAIDTEHGAADVRTVQAMLQAGGQSDAVIMARVSRLDQDEIRRHLDVGAMGIICPFVNSAGDAASLVRACRYPPAGVRGFGPRRSGRFGFDAAEYFQEANSAIICVGIIESAQAIAEIDSIVATDGIDAVLIGPADLSLSLGVFMQYDDHRYLAAVEEVRRACRAHHKAMGTGCHSVDHAVQCIRAGDQLLLLGGDDGFLAAEAARVLAAVTAPGPQSGA
jgi:4-hydroxy-2-oxoheptanedioate aldolase